MSTIILSGCAIMRQDKLLLIMRKNGEIWELPGGCVDSAKGIEQNAADKTKAQIGVSPTLIQQFSVLEYQKNGSNIEATIFECDIDPESTIIPGEDVKEVRWFPLAELGKENIGEDVREILEEL